MKAKIVSILKEIRPEFDFNSSDSFIDQGMLDSFDIVTLVTMLDEHFEISIDGTEIIPDNFSNLDSIEKLLKKYVKS